MTSPAIPPLAAVPTTDPVLAVPPSTQSSEDAKRVFLSRYFIALSVLGVAVSTVQSLLAGDISALNLGLAIGIVVMFAACGVWLAHLVRPQILALAASLLTATAVGVSVASSGDASGLLYLLAPVLLMTSIFPFRIAGAFAAGCIVEVILIYNLTGTLDPSVLANVSAAILIGFTVSSLMSTMWNTAFDAQRVAERESAILMRRALSAGFPANAMLEDDVIHAPSAAFVTLFGGDAKDGGPISSLCDAADLEPLKDAIAVQVPLEIHKGDRIIEIFSAPVPSRDLPAGKVKRVLAARDVTDKARLAEQLATSQRVVALGELAAGVAHEIQNPLTSLVLCVGFLEEGHPAEPDDITEIQRAAERIRQTVNDLIALTNSRGEQSVPTLVDDTIVSAMRIAEATIRAANGKVTVEHSDGDLAMLAAPTRTSQALAHLLVNAVTAQGDPPKRTPRVQVTTSQSGDFVEIRISDNGLGVAPEVAHRIFDPFVSTREVGEGAGLGLSLAHNVMTDADGTLVVEHTSDEGTTFLARLPVANEGFDEDSSEAVLRATNGLDGATALVAVDDASVREAIARILRETLSSVVETEVAAAGKMAAARSFDVVICEVSARATNGVDVLSQLPPSTMGVALTGGSFSPQVQDFLATWEGDVLRKPVTHGRLFKVLNRLGMRSK